MKVISKLVLSSVAALFVSQSVMADEFVIGSGTRPLTVGLGMVYHDKPYKNFDSGEKSQMVPIVLYEGEHFFARGAILGWDFMGSDSPLEVAVIGQYLAEGYDSSDSKYLKGNGDRDPSFGVGGQVIWKPQDLGFKFSAVQDVTDNSDGAQAVGQVFYKYNFGNFNVTPSASVIWQNSDFNDYYYGVRSKAVNASAYSADSDFNYRLGVMGVYQLENSAWMITGGLSYEILGDEITDSSIVSEDEQLKALIGVAYTFK